MRELILSDDAELFYWTCIIVISEISELGLEGQHVQNLAALMVNLSSINSNSTFEWGVGSEFSSIINSFTKFNLSMHDHILLFVFEDGRLRLERGI